MYDFEKRFENFVYHAIGPITTANIGDLTQVHQKLQVYWITFLNNEHETTTTASPQQQPNIYGKLNFFAARKEKRISIIFLKKSFKKRNKKFGKSLKTKTPKKNKTFVYVL